MILENAEPPLMCKPIFLSVNMWKCYATAWIILYNTHLYRIAEYGRNKCNVVPYSFRREFPPSILI